MIQTRAMKGVLAVRLSRGETLERCGRVLGLNKAAVYRTVKQLDIERDRRTRMTDAERAEILAAIVHSNLSRRQLGRKFGRAGSTIQRLANQLRVKPRAHRMRTARRCPGCGARVAVWPCIACEARKKTRG